ncbi:hypothetical protein EON66_11600, partial [archaeon]
MSWPVLEGGNRSRQETLTYFLVHWTAPTGGACSVDGRRPGLATVVLVAAPMPAPALYAVHAASEHAVDTNEAIELSASHEFGIQHMPVILAVQPAAIAWSQGVTLYVFGTALHASLHLRCAFWVGNDTLGATQLEVFNSTHAACETPPLHAAAERMRARVATARDSYFSIDVRLTSAVHSTLSHAAAPLLVHAPMTLGAVRNPTVFTNASRAPVRVPIFSAPGLAARLQTGGYLHVVCRWQGEVTSGWMEAVSSVHYALCPVHALAGVLSGDLLTTNATAALEVSVDGGHVFLLASPRLTIHGAPILLRASPEHVCAEGGTLIFVHGMQLQTLGASVLCTFVPRAPPVLGRPAQEPAHTAPAMVLS